MGVHRTCRQANAIESAAAHGPLHVSITIMIHRSIAGVPFGHWQFDSWFYPKDGSVNAGGGGGSVINWTVPP